jgi:hypothetical protein
MEPHVVDSTAVTDENWSQSIHAPLSPDTNMSLKVSGDSNTLATPLPVG